MLSLANSMDTEVSVVSPTEAMASATRPAGSRRRRLSPDEERDIARLYADKSTSTSEIRERFGIRESSLYRVVQRHGVGLRGRSASPAKPSLPLTRVPATRGRRSFTTSGAKPAGSRSTPRPIEVLVRARAVKPPTGGSAQQRFRIQFQGESVFEATDIRDALRQAESLGATEITAVARVER